ncbi:MAG: hypothetical protein IJY39_00470 [Clostridia bacterium]|nr:hypothetical protein [Clostridia bacterium]
MKLEYKKLGNICHGQDGCVWENLIFRFGGDGICRVYDLNDLAPLENGEAKRIATFKLDKADDICPHCNSVCFGKERYAEDDEYPLLYCNLYNSYDGKEDEMWGVCCVYRLQRDGEGFMTTLVQIIEIGFAHNADLWCSRRPGEGRDMRPFGNFVVDAENGLYHCFVMRDKPQKTRYFTFKLPKIADGQLDPRFNVNRVILTEADILSKYDCDYSSYLQGACVHNGLIYSTEGGTKSYTSPATLTISDPKAFRQILRLSLIYFGLENEPEFIYFVGDRCIYIDNIGGVFELFIEI